MTQIPCRIQALIEDWGGPIRAAARLGGGMIGHAFRVDLDAGPVLVKWADSAPGEMLAAEQNGLRALTLAGALRAPQPITFHDSRPEFLIIEYIEPLPPTNAERFAERFGQGLADLHRFRSSVSGFGHDEDNFIGNLTQENGWISSWPEFYRSRRIRPQMETARRLGRLPPHRERLLFDLCERLETLLDGLDSTPSLLHGDLWSGNYLSAGDEPVVFDPAVYWGERELEIAYMQLFGGFPDRLFRAYNEAFPLQAGYERRRPLHQLYPLLVHLNHFGETYGPDVDAVCRKYLK